jgi:hypothetical protein
MPSKGTKEEKGKDSSPNKKAHPKMQNAQWGALRGENTKPKTLTHYHEASCVRRWVKNIGHQA